MATTNNNQNQADEHHMNTGKTVLQVKHNFTISATEHTANQTLSTIIEITNATHRNGYSGVIKSITLRNTNSTPAAKATAVYFISKQSIPATAPAQTTDLVMIDADAAYIVGRVDFAAADWKTIDDIAIQTKVNIDIPFINEDTTVSTTLYMFLVHTDSTHTYSASQKMYVDLFIEQN